METEPLKLSLFTGFGVELEYMIIKEDSLDVLPITDQLLYNVSGAFETDAPFGELGLSNELALHVIEIKNPGPVTTLEEGYFPFQEAVIAINHILKPFHAFLMPTAMHPWMNPDREMRLWPHAYNPIYEAYHRIFDCRGHGWANLQSTHLNLPFQDDDEFKKLHGAIRYLLAFMPALAAASPFVEGKKTEYLDYRLEAYRWNAKKIPSITGLVIPEPVSSQKEYEEVILKPMYKAIAPFDPDQILQEEWLNSRGAIARFDRYTIEIRVLDIQECPLADFALLELVIGALRALTEERWVSIDFLNQVETEKLASLLFKMVEKAEDALIEDSHILKAFGLKGPLKARDVWMHLYESTWTSSDPLLTQAILTILKEGTLATRLVRAYDRGQSLPSIYRTLSECLERGELFEVV